MESSGVSLDAAKLEAISPTNPATEDGECPKVVQGFLYFPALALRDSFVGHQTISGN
jgi:hypothetical protein